MGKYEKLYLQILSGTADHNIKFEDLRWFLKRLGFNERIRGSHHIFTRDQVAEIINIQPKGNKAKPYQVKQIRNLVTQYKLGAIGDE